MMLLPFVIVLVESCTQKITNPYEMFFFVVSSWDSFFDSSNILGGVYQFYIRMICQTSPQDFFLSMSMNGSNLAVVNFCKWKIIPKI